MDEQLLNTHSHTHLRARHSLASRFVRQLGCAVAGLALLAACGPKAPGTAEKVTAATGVPAATGSRSTEAKSKTAARSADEPFVVRPTATPPPPPEGAVTLAPNPGETDPKKSLWLYVQDCSDVAPCPKFLQTEAEVHCREFKLGVREHGWRLPSRHEAERFSQLEGLAQRAGYHWTRTPFAEDMMQVWIVDPSGAGPSTTIPRKRKPFTVRCVMEP